MSVKALIVGVNKYKLPGSDLQGCFNDAKSGDKLLFHFSSHGSQIRDRDGDELKDQLDEIICPHDMDWDGTYIVDDDLNAVFSKISAKPSGMLRAPSLALSFSNACAPP